MTFTITPDTAVASVAQHIIDNHSRQKAATLLADMYDKQMEYMMNALEATDSEAAFNEAAFKHAENIANITIIAKAHNIHRDMHVERLKRMPYRG